MGGNISKDKRLKAVCQYIYSHPPLIKIREKKNMVKLISLTSATWLLTSSFELCKILLERYNQSPDQELDGRIINLLRVFSYFIEQEQASLVNEDLPMEIGELPLSTPLLGLAEISQVFKQMHDPE